jgi:hypothetical protein
VIFSRKRSRAAIAEAVAARREAEAAEQDAAEHVLGPLRRMRERNHVAADIAARIRAKGAGQGEPGAAAH